MTSNASWDKSHVRVSGQTHPPGRNPLLGRHPTGQCILGYGQQAGGTYPTGMHSCFEDENHIYCPQTKFAKVMFLHLSAILFTGGVCPGGCPGPGPGGVSQHALRQTAPPPPSSRWLLLRTVRILLECILVVNIVVITEDRSRLQPIPLQNKTAVSILFVKLDKTLNQIVQEG